MSRSSPSSPGARVFIHREERVPSSLPVRFGVGRAGTTATAGNLSEGGLHIRTNDVLPAGTRIEIEIDFPARTISHRGEVMWAIRVPEHARETLVHGMGVRFVQVEPDWSSFFRGWKEGVDRSEAQEVSRGSRAARS